jgi:CRISPR-associated protein Cmr4
MLYLHALTAIHSGTGQGIGYIDQPVARDPTTGWPILPGSSIKGVLRAHSEGINAAMTMVVFGPKTNKAHEHAGAVLFPDAHIVALPIRSLYGSFAWVTTPLVLSHWVRDRKGLGHATTLTIPALDGSALDTLATTGSVLRQNGKVYLEAYDLNATESAEVDAIATAIATAAFDDPGWRTVFQKRLLVVSGFLFDRLCDAALEVTARIRLNEQSKTVARGGLWYEEAVPAESVFASPLLPGDVDVKTVHKSANITVKDVWDHLTRLTAGGEVLQVGGNASVGKGLIRFALDEEGVTP